jgi:hypothetical protein
MTNIDLREALHEVADATPAPDQDRMAFQRLVRRERRRHHAARAGVVAVAAAAAVAVVATVIAPFVGDEGARDLPPAVRPHPGLGVDLQAPVYFVADGQLTALDPQGGVHDLGLRSEDVIGSTSESVYAIGPDSQVVRFDVHNSDEGAGGPWEFERVDAGVEGPVQGAALSPDGRWIGWIDLDGRLTVRDLKAGTSTGPVDLPANSGLSGLAQGTGDALVSEDGDLVLRTPDGPVVIPTAEDGYGAVAQAARDVVALMDRDDRTRIYDVSTGTATLLDTVPGGGVLAPYGDHLVSVSFARNDSSTVLLWSAGGETGPLSVPGRPQAAAWADDDTALVATYDGDATALYACDVATRGCERLPVDGVEDVTLAR